MNKPRLIDANFIEQYVTREEHKTPDERWRPESEFVALIDNAPTAYDIDKVVEQLEEKIKKHERMANIERRIGSTYKRKQHERAVKVLNEAIEIVKGGAE